MVEKAHSDKRISRVDAGLLILRLGAGLTLFVIFGLQKLKAGAAFASGHSWEFVDFNRKIGLPAPVLIAYFQTFNESIGALLVAFGLLTPFAAGSVALGFVAALFCSLKADESVLLPIYYSFMFASLALTGPGKMSIDYLLLFMRGTGG
jgi:uncharacterized membrane protein YphA (DoxX/SURF4 family)